MVSTSLVYLGDSMSYFYNSVYLYIDEPFKTFFINIILYLCICSVDMAARYTVEVVL